MQIYTLYIKPNKLYLRKSHPAFKFKPQYFYGLEGPLIMD